MGIMRLLTSGTKTLGSLRAVSVPPGLGSGTGWFAFGEMAFIGSGDRRVDSQKEDAHVVEGAEGLGQGEGLLYVRNPEGMGVLVKMFGIKGKGMGNGVIREGAHDLPK